MARGEGEDHDDSQYIRAGQKPYVPHGERKRRAQGS
jgi:hypothetical protein